MPRHMLLCADADVGSYVVVKYDAVNYAGIIEEVRNGDYLVNVMERCRGGWRWPCHKDCLWYKDIVKTVSPPLPVNSRGLFVFNDSVC